MRLYIMLWEELSLVVSGEGVCEGILLVGAGRLKKVDSKCENWYYLVLAWL